MKKLFTLVLSLLLVVTMAGCSSSNTSDNPVAKATLTGNKIIVGTSPDYPPFESLDAAGNLEGFEISLMEMVVAEINKQNGTKLEVEFKQMDFSLIIGALQASQIDVGCSGFTYSADRDCIFTTPHNISKQVIVTRNDTGIKSADDLTGKKVAAGTGTTGAEALAEVIGKDNVLYPGDYTYMMQQLQAGQLDAVVCDEAVGVNYVDSMGLVVCEEALVDEEMSFIIKTGNTVLADAFNKAVEAVMASSEFEALNAQWLAD